MCCSGGNRDRFPVHFWQLLSGMFSSARPATGQRCTMCLSLPLGMGSGTGHITLLTAWASDTGVSAFYRGSREAQFWKMCPGGQYLQPTEAGPQPSLALLGMGKVARAGVRTSVRPRGPHLDNPQRKLSALGDRQLKARCTAAPSPAAPVTHPGCTRGRGHSSQLAGAPPLCTPPARSQHARATSPLSRRHLGRNGEQRGVTSHNMVLWCQALCRHPA